MSLVSFEELGIGQDSFCFALVKLQNEGLINGLAYEWTLANDLIILSCARVMPTRLGIEYVEKKLEIERSWTGKKKLEWLRDKCGELGWDLIKAYVMARLSGM